MIEKIVLSMVYFLLFVYIFVFKLIKKNDTAYLVIIIMQAIGILLNLVQILFNVYMGIIFKILIYIFCIIIPTFILVIESRNINFSEITYICISKCLLFVGKTKKAKELLTKLIEKYDKNYSAHKMLAEIYEEEGGMRKAIDEYIKVLDIKGDDYKSYFKISKLLISLERKDEAIQMLGILIKKKPEMYEANENLRRFINGKGKI